MICKHFVMESQSILGYRIMQEQIILINCNHVPKLKYDGKDFVV